MKSSSGWGTALLLGIVLMSPCFGSGQTPSEDYPTNVAGILIQGSDWTQIDAAMPSKTRAKGTLAQSLTYGAVRGNGAADYNGEHADVQINPGRVVICVCRYRSIPGDPILVKLHPQKGMRELDLGKLPVLGGKVAAADKSDLVPADVSHPDNMTWLVRSQQPLPAGEYALMLGTQNIAIFPFTISIPANDAPPAKDNH